MTPHGGQGAAGEITLYWLLAFVVFIVVLLGGIWFLQRFYAKATLKRFEESLNRKDSLGV